MKKILKVGCLLFIAIPIIFYVAALFIDVDDIKKLEVKETEKTKVEKPKAKAIVKKEILKFKTIDFTKVGLKTENRATQKIEVKSISLPSKELLINTAENIWKKNKSYSEFTIFIYLKDMDINSSAYCIVEFDKKRMTDFILSKSSLYDTKWEVK